MARYSLIQPNPESRSEQDPFGTNYSKHSDIDREIPMKTFNASGEELPPTSSNGSSDERIYKLGDKGNNPNGSGNQGSWKLGSKDRVGTGISLTPSAPWTHKLSEKYLGDVPASSDTVRYFNRRRQARRVFIDCLIMWSGTAIICAGMAGTMYGFSTIIGGMSQWQKYGYNALVTGFSVVLGLAFAAQFKQYAEMMRWRFLASEYRNLEDFELVLDCDSYRSTLAIIFGGWRKGKWYPSKAQVIAIWWFLLFVAFNVFVALIGLTYSIDVSEKFVYTVPGEVDVANLRYIANTDQPDDGAGYDITFQEAAANLFGQLGQSQVPDFDDAAVYTFIDRNPGEGKSTAVTSRTISSVATCEELVITYGGYAGFQTNDTTLQNLLEWQDSNGNNHSESITTTVTGATTWMGNTTLDGCGPRCAQVLALQSSDSLLAGNEVSFMPVPRLWACNNTLSHVTIGDPQNEGFNDTELLDMPDLQAGLMAGAIGWTGVCQDKGDGTCTDLQYMLYNGDTTLSLVANVTAEQVAHTVMAYTYGAVAAFDSTGPRQNLTGAYSPRPAQVVTVKWNYAGAILAGIPFVQFVLLLGVVWFSSKAIIIEPGYMAIAHLLKPIVEKMGDAGPLLSMEEISEHIGEYNIAYNVRPDPNDPGHHDRTFVRDLDLIDEKEGFGYIRGKMPEGRYD